MIVKQLAPDAGHRRELSCGPPVAERACGRVDHHAPPRALGPPWAGGQLSRRCVRSLGVAYALQVHVHLQVQKRQAVLAFGGVRHAGSLAWLGLWGLPAVGLHLYRRWLGRVLRSGLVVVC